MVGGVVGGVAGFGTVKTEHGRMPLGNAPLSLTQSNFHPDNRK